VITPLIAQIEKNFKTNQVMDQAKMELMRQRPTLLQTVTTGIFMYFLRPSDHSKLSITSDSICDEVESVYSLYHSISKNASFD
jgi:hypothetical protein